MVRATRPSADATRQRILAAALELFASSSFDGASTREIAARAGVTQPLLLHHFRSKVELWRAAVGGVFSDLAEALGRETDAEAVIRQFVEFSAEHPELHRIITQECKADTPRMDWLVERHIRPLYERATAMLARLVEEGRVPPIPLEHLYYILTGAGPTMFVLAPECRRLTGVDPQSPDVVRAHADAVITLLFGPQR